MILCLEISSVHVVGLLVTGLYGYWFMCGGLCCFIDSIYCHTVLGNESLRRPVGKYKNLLIATWSVMILCQMKRKMRKRMTWRKVQLLVSDFYKVNKWEYSPKITLHEVRDSGMVNDVQKVGIQIWSHKMALVFFFFFFFMYSQIWLIVPSIFFPWIGQLIINVAGVEFYKVGKQNCFLLQFIDIIWQALYYR